jgi:hypothetical protein
MGIYKLNPDGQLLDQIIRLFFKSLHFCGALLSQVITLINMFSGTIILGIPILSQTDPSNDVINEQQIHQD